MKLNTLFVAGVCASALLVSCNPNKTASENQLKYTHTSLADGDAFNFFQLVGAKAVYELDYASYVEEHSASAQEKQLAAKVKEVYASIVPTLDSLATLSHVDFPIKGGKVFVAPTEEHNVAHSHVQEHSSDSTAHAATHVHSDDHANHGGYVHHVQHESAIIKDQLERLSRNTNTDLRAFASENLEKVAELFKLAGGKEDAHGHH
ncbi:hypothetical protein [Sphingobacterium sp. LRF_L2]|uniref:hypothetical protein n=1 Tax=Sphingobacterium sp. LRF_L2 TaxID=3369421 RepID=UPI003F640AE9